MPEPLTRSELIKALRDHFPQLSPDAVDQAARTMLEHLASSLASGRRIEIRDFGAFSLRHHPAQTRRNPRTGEAVTVSAKSSIYFRPGKGLLARVNGWEE